MKKFMQKKEVFLPGFHPKTDSEMLHQIAEFLGEMAEDSPRDLASGNSAVNYC